MWKTIIEQGTVTKHKSVFDFDVVFEKDGEFYDRFQFKNVSDPASIKQLIRNQLQQYQKIDSIDPVALEGEVDLTPPPTPEIPVLTPEELKKFEYEAKRQEVLKAKQDLDCGLLTTSEFQAKLSEAVSIKPTK